MAPPTVKTTRESPPVEATRIKPKERALVVIDMVPALVYEGGPRAVPGAAELIRYIQGELRYFRERDRCVVFAVRRPAEGEEPASVIADLTPRSRELILSTSAPSAFFGTPLEEHLRARGAGRVTLVGVGTATSVLLTAADAYARGFGVSVPDPCVVDPNPEDHRFALHLIRDVWAPKSPGEAQEVTSPAAVLEPLP